MTDNEQISGKFTSQIAKSDWAVKASVQPEEDQKPKTFLEKIAPKSKKGRVVFAAGTAQVVSISLTALAGYLFKNHKPEKVKDWEASIVRVFNDKTMKSLWETNKAPGLLRDERWKGFMDYDDYQNIKAYSAAGDLESLSKKHAIQAGTLTQFVAMGLTNILSTISVRNLLDDRLDINLGGNKVLKTQMIDTAVGIGAMIGIPSIPFLAKPLRDARYTIQKTVNKIPVKEENISRRDELGKSLGFSAVNITLPDFIGFAAGINATFRELDALEKEKEAEKKLQEIEAKENGHTRG